MKRVGIFYGRFDPLTSDHLLAARRFIADNSLNVLYFVVEPEGEREWLTRLCLLKKALKPYRKMQAAQKLNLTSGISCFSLKESEELQKKSTEVRNGCFQSLPRVLRRDVIESGIYGDSIIRSMVNDHRYRHSLSVAQLSAQIAQAHHLDSRKAWLIGLYHDIAKGLSEQQTDDYIKIEKPYEFSYPEAVWHAWVGYYLLKHVYGMKDKEMLRAVRHHCLGDDDSPLGMIVYLADKLESGRGYDSSKEIELAKRDLKAAFELVHQQQAEYLAGKEKV